MHKHTCAHTITETYAQRDKLTHTQTHILTQTPTYIYTHLYTHKTQICTYIHIDTHMHTDMQTETHTPWICEWFSLLKISPEAWSSSWTPVHSGSWLEHKLGSCSTAWDFVKKSQRPCFHCMTAFSKPPAWYLAEPKKWCRLQWGWMIVTTELWHWDLCLKERKILE